MFFTIGSERIRVNIPDRIALISEITRRFRAGEGFALATVNLDHLVKMSRDASFAATYADQDLIVADGRPIVWLSRLARHPVELVPGSDMVIPLARLAAAETVPVALVGSTQDALRDASKILSKNAKSLNVVCEISPEYGFDPDGEEADRILLELDAKKVGLCFLALGAPKQERLAARGRSLAPGVGFASVGAGLDFLGGHQKRAPMWMRRFGLEWLWRALADPIRLVPRYAQCFAILPSQMRAAIRLRNGS